MPKLAGEPLTKVTFNMYTKDLEWFQAKYGYGYSEELRKVIRRYIIQRDKVREYCIT